MSEGFGVKWSAIEPEFGFGNVEIVVPDDAVTASIDLRGFEESFVAEQFASGQARLRGEIVETRLAVHESHAELKAAEGFNRGNSRIIRPIAHGLVESWKRVEVLGVPHGAKLHLVDLRPFAHEAMGTWWQIAFEHFQRVDGIDADMLTIHRVKVRHAMLREEHLDDDTVESGDDGHDSFG